MLDPPSPTNATNSSSSSDHDTEHDPKSTLYTLAALPGDTLASLGIKHAQGGLALTRSGDDLIVEPYILKRGNTRHARYSRTTALPKGMAVREAKHSTLKFLSTHSTIYNAHQPLPATYLAELISDSWVRFRSTIPESSGTVQKIGETFAALYPNLLRDTVSGTREHKGLECTAYGAGGLYKMAEMLDGRRAALSFRRNKELVEEEVSTEPVTHFTEDPSSVPEEPTHLEALNAFREFLIAQSQAETSSCAVILAKMNESLRGEYNDSLKNRESGQYLSGGIVARAYSDDERDVLVTMRSKAATDVATMETKWSVYASMWKSLNETAKVPKTFRQYSRVLRDAV